MDVKNTVDDESINCRDTVFQVSSRAYLDIPADHGSY